MSKTPSARAPFRRALIPALLLLAGAGAATQVLAHGDMVPHAVDTTGLKPLGKDWEASNPYRGSDRAKEIGATGYNQNCARCHGLDAKSGGIAPDLRYLDVGADGEHLPGAHVLARVAVVDQHVRAEGEDRKSVV